MAKLRLTSGTERSDVALHVLVMHINKIMDEQKYKLDQKVTVLVHRQKDVPDFVATITGVIRGHNGKVTYIVVDEEGNQWSRYSNEDFA